MRQLGLVKGGKKRRKKLDAVRIPKVLEASESPLLAVLWWTCCPVVDFFLSKILLFRFNQIVYNEAAIITNSRPPKAPPLELHISQSLFTEVQLWTNSLFGSCPSSKILEILRYQNDLLGSKGKAPIRSFKLQAYFKKDILSTFSNDSTHATLLQNNLVNANMPKECIIMLGTLISFVQICLSLSLYRKAPWLQS